MAMADPAKRPGDANTGGMLAVVLKGLSPINDPSLRGHASQRPLGGMGGSQSSWGTHSP